MRGVVKMGDSLYASRYLASHRNDVSAASWKTIQGHNPLHCIIARDDQPGLSRQGFPVQCFRRIHRQPCSTYIHRYDAAASSDTQGCSSCSMLYSNES